MKVRSRSVTLPVPVCAAGLVLLSTTAANAETRRVPQQYPTIQAAINASIDGDTVLVGRGIWSGPGNHDIDTLGKAITVRSVGGAATCVIDASDSVNWYHSGFVFTNSESPETVIDGFTIMNGYSFNGGGIYVESGSPTIQNCILTANTCDCWGAAVYFNSQTSPTLRNCLITGNTSAAEGGGIFTIDSGGRVENCIITDNVANTGGGLCIFGGDVEFVSCQVTGNTATWSGGGGYFYEGNLINCTIADNHAAFDSAGIYTWSNVTTIANSIIWGNTGAAQLTGTPILSYSIVEGGFAGSHIRSVDPRFVDAAAGDYRLRALSPAIDAGSNPAVPEGFAVDADGMPRFVNDAKTRDTGVGPFPIIDLGAFEFRATLTNPK